MKSFLTLLILSCFMFNSKENSISELNLIDAYNLKIENVPIFGNLNSQIDLFGLPDKVLQQNKELKYKTKKDILNQVKEDKNFTVINFKGIEFWCFDDFDCVPTKIDFRKFNQKISNGNLFYSKDYTLNNFKEEFPESFKNSPKMPISFFEMATKKKTDNLKHYFIERYTKDDESVKLLIEFTFKNDKLIYIFFSNFS